MTVLSLEDAVRMAKVIRQGPETSPSPAPGLPGLSLRLAALWLAACPVLALGGVEEPVSYNHEVRPVLAAKCFSCHGADAGNRKGDLRLDQREAAVEAGAIVPGQPEAGSLLERIRTRDADEIMPPPEKHDPLTEEETTLLQRWLAEGAVYEPHWAFTSPVKPAVPGAAGAAYPIDAFVRAALARKGWLAAPPAPRHEWLRRVSLALTGLPPTPAEIEDFERDPSGDDLACARVVDRLLASPHYGERMAAVWLDAARYGDTFGRHEDADNSMWPWRDWVIGAFNGNLPYDRFITWQMAGDLLPGATQDQILATAFHRLAVQSNESGSDPEEFRWDQVFDRVNTTATAIMGLTLECSRCHDHKYDPFSAKEYYQLAAFFDKIDELGLFSRYTNGVPAPSAYLYQGDEQARHEMLKQAVAEAEQAWLKEQAEAAPRYASWLRQHAPPGRGGGLWGELAAAPGSMKAESLMPRPEVYLSFDFIDHDKRCYIVDSDPAQLIDGSASVKEETPGVSGRACRFFSHTPKKYGIPEARAHYLKWTPFTFAFWFQADTLPEHGVILHRSRAGMDAANRGYELTFEDGRLTATLAHFYPGNAIRVQAVDKLDFAQWRHVAFSYDGSSQASGLSLYVDGRKLPVQIVRDHLYKDIDYLAEWGDLDNTQVADADASSAITLKIGGRTLDTGLRDASVDELHAYDRKLSDVEIAYLHHGDAGPDDAVWLEWYQREVDEPCRQALAKLTAARRAEAEFTTRLREIMVMDESHGPKRETRFLQRGDYRHPGDKVTPGTPAALNAFPQGAPEDRRGLAMWLTDTRHPLTSRVQVNRIWSLFFGRGLVNTQQDFGLQGSAPSHPALLDWLAVHFTETGWDMKALCREIALSATFRQSSIPADAALLREDPDNVCLARGPRLRLSAEQLRDAALAGSGLLMRAVGGPSVKPYQPAGLWEDNGTQHIYNQDHGHNLHRRSLYTFWRRTCPPPVMSIFDAPTREFCLVKRQDTLTPLQALALMNDTGFLECARVLGESLTRLHPDPAQDGERVADAFRRLTGHDPSPAQQASMTALIREAREHFKQHPEDAARLLGSTGETPSDAALPAQEAAATLLMTRALLSSEPFVHAY